MRREWRAGGRCCRSGRQLLAGALLVIAAGAQAGVGARVTVATGYQHRGLDHSQSSPAYQVSVEYQRPRSGWFAGIWASSVDFGPYDDRDSEIDYYLGFARRFSPELAIEATVIRYTFQGRSPQDEDWSELQLTAYLASRWTVTWGIADHWWGAEETSQFTEITYRHPLPFRLVLDATGGYQLAERAAGLDYAYVEAGLARRWRGLIFRFGYAATDSSARARFQQFAHDGWIGSVTWPLLPSQ